MSLLHLSLGAVEALGSAMGTLDRLAAMTPDQLAATDPAALSVWLRETHGQSAVVYAEIVGTTTAAAPVGGEPESVRAAHDARVLGTEGGAR